MRKKEQNKNKRPTQWTKLRKDIRKENREVLEKSLYELTAAYNIGREASRTFDLQNCLKVLGDRIADLLSVEIVSVMLMDKYEDGLILEFAKGLKREITREKVKVGQGIAGWIAKTGQPLLIKDISADERFKKRNGKYSTDSLLSVPLKVNNKVIGVINVNNKASKEIFSEEDMDTLMKVADLAAAAIESARLQQEAKARDEIRLEFISNISHEFRTPLSCIREAVALVLDEIPGKINKEQKGFLETAKQNAARLNNLVDELLKLARAEAEVTRMKRRLFDVVEFIDGVILSLGPLGEEKGISIKKVLPDGKVEIWADSDKLEDVLINLVANAVKYNKPNGNVTISIDETDRFVKIHVADTGLGIAKEDLKKIFDRFYRIEKQATREIPGAGIGLAIAGEIIKKHGGDISVESVLGKGSKFTVTLPKDLRAEQKR